MKKTLLISIFCLAFIGSYAQDAQSQPATSTAVCKRDPNMPKGAVPAWPKSPYISTQSAECAPCYTYTSKHGIPIMECPFLHFLPENGTAATQTEGNINAAQATTVDMNVQTVNSYTGNYPKVCRRDPNMPKGAVPAWPKSEYTSLQPSSECAPCYEYTSKHGIRIMECPFLYFAPEDKK